METITDRLNFCRGYSGVQSSCTPAFGGLMFGGRGSIWGCGRCAHTVGVGGAWPWACCSQLFSDARPQAASGAASIFLGPRCTVQLASVHRQDGRNRILILPKHGRTSARARYIKQHLPPQVRHPPSSGSGLSLWLCSFPLPAPGL